MSDEDGGDATIDAYEAGMDAYLAAQGDHPAMVVRWLERFAAALPPSGRVLEIGSGPGRDADLLEGRGLHVQRSDATRAFADRLRSRGHAVLDLDVRRDPLPADLDGVLANAVLLHLQREELASALQRIRAALAPGGVLAFSMKEGDGEEWSTAKLGRPRRFTYWRADALRAAVTGAGFTVLSLERAAGRSDDWLQVLAAAA